MISIIVPSTGRHSEVTRLCDSLMGQVLHEEFEAFIVCNPPSEKIEQLIQHYPSKIRYLDTENLGANSARNCGVRAASGRYLFFFDDDCELPNADFLAQRISLLDQRQDLDGCGGGYLPKRMTTAWATAYYFLQQKWLLEGQTDAGLQRYLIGGNMTLRKEVFERHGLFTEKLKFGGTETEFFARQKDSRFVFLKESGVYHSYDIGFFDFLKKAFMQGVGRSFIESLWGEEQGTRMRYGHSGVLQVLNLKAVSHKAIGLYDLAFQAGELFHSQTGLSRPTKKEIYFYIMKMFFSKRRKTQRRFFDRCLCLMDNYRKRIT